MEITNNHHYHESLNNVNPADVYHGRDKEILSMRYKIKQKTLKVRQVDNLMERGTKKLSLPEKFTH